jgi:hypothetical protein
MQTLSNILKTNTLGTHVLAFAAATSPALVWLAMWEVSSAGQLWHRLRDCEKMYDEVMKLAGDPPRIVDSSSTNAVNFSSARLMKRFPLLRCASTIQIVCPLKPIAETQPQLQPALLRLSAMISQYRFTAAFPRRAFGSADRRGVGRNPDRAATTPG